MTEAAGKDLSEVLMSLRKLVSDEPEADEPGIEPIEKGAETLVLCPSLRVDDSEPAAPPSLEDKITKLERLIASTDQLWEPDDEEQDEFAGSHTAIPQEALTAVVSAGSIETQVIAQETVSSQIAAAAPVGIDETELRSMVSEMIRDELRGALGEKITKNIRKLVRREINSALLKQRIE